MQMQTGSDEVERSCTEPNITLATHSDVTMASPQPPRHDMSSTLHIVTRLCNKSYRLNYALWVIAFRLYIQLGNIQLGIYPSFSHKWYGNMVHPVHYAFIPPRRWQSTTSRSHNSLHMTP